MIIKAVGGLHVAVGVLLLLAPLRFYQFSMKLFTPDVSPPFSQGTIVAITLFLLLPSIVLVANGIALLSLGYSLKERAPLVLRGKSSPREERSARGYVRAESTVKHEYMGMEVYDRRGNYYGKVEDVNLDPSGRTIEFYSRRGNHRKAFSPQEIDRAEDVILLRRRV